MSGQQPITIRSFSQSLSVAGGYLEGVVQLYFPLIQSEEIEEVHIKLRGIARTVIHRNNNTERQTISLVRQNRSLWTRGIVYPEPGMHTLQLPYKFMVPDGLPPSFAFAGAGKKAGIYYSLEAVGVRPGLLRMNRRVVHPLAVLPSDVTGAQLRSQLQAGWTGSWKTIVRQERVRKGLWGDYANVKMEFTYPAIERIPLFTAIPFTLKIRTVSKPMKPEETPQDKPVFPAPPSARAVELHLRRSVRIQTRRWRVSSGDSLPSLGGMGTSSVPCNVEAPERVWQPTDSGKGVWVQEANFSSTILLKCPPTFNSETVEVAYDMHLQVNFGGLFNSLVSDFPVRVVSGLLPLENQVDWAAQHEPMLDQPGLPSYEPPALDLPPAYWNGSGADYEDQKE